MEWIAFTIFAALMQSVRTAGQKHMTSSLSAIVATWARYGFGLPFAIVYFFVVLNVTDTSVPTLNGQFMAYVIIAAVAQLIATLLLVKVLSLRNFTVGTTYAKTEGLLAALVAAAVFGVQLSPLAWAAICIGIGGIIFVSLSKSQIGLSTLVSGRSAVYGLCAGLGFAVTAVFIREANQALSASAIVSAAYILFLSLLIQGVLCSVLVHWQNPDNWRQLKGRLKTGWFVGITGMLGSVGWYTAFAYQEAALVKTLGNIEFIFTILLTYLFFKEKVTAIEWIGIAGVLCSVLLLLAV
jgi:drug/metabolite transporter (DMT)-like permease